MRSMAKGIRSRHRFFHFAPARQRSGLTLVECLVVIAIVIVLIAVVLPGVQAAREAARRAQCHSRMRQIALALHHYHDARSALPSGKLSDRGGNLYPHAYWLAFILPYIEHQADYDDMELSYSRQRSPFFPNAHAIGSRPINTYECPSDDRVMSAQRTRNDRFVALTSYVGCVGSNHTMSNGVLFLDSKVMFSAISDGTSNTIAFGERPPSPDFWYGWWYAGLGDEGDGVPDALIGAYEINDITGSFMLCGFGPHSFKAGRADRMCDTLHFWSLHPSGANFAFADGAVRFVRYDGKDLVLQYSTRNGNDVTAIE